MTKKITLPTYDPETENWAEAGMAAWIEAHGGTDVTYNTPDDPPDYGAWVGDWQAPDGTVCRLLVDDRTEEIHAYELLVQYDLGEEIAHGGEHLWTGAEWLAETRTMDAIRADIHADLPDDAEGEFITVLGEAFEL